MRRLTEDLFICYDCRHVSSNIRPDPSIYDRSYTIKYERYGRTELGKKIQIARIDMMLSQKYRKFVNILDFGCGVGSFIKSAKNIGIEIEGFDINPYSKYCDVTTLFKYQYDIVTFWDSLEHIADPVTLILGLKPDYIFACTPCLDSLGPDYLNYRYITSWKHYMPHEHCHYFSAHSIASMFEAMGYRVIDINYRESSLRKGNGPKNIISIGGVLRGKD